jgi:ABC-type transport system involved in cytochrome bd biosynthesis fused ATPase/permease subunit
MMRSRLLAVLSVGLLVMAISACSSAAATPTPQAAAEQALCTALANWATAIHDLAAIDPATATIDDVKAQAKKIQDAWATVQSGLQGVQVANEAALESAWAALSKALGTIGTDVPLSTLIADLKAAAGEVKTAYTQMVNGMGCPQVNPLQ